VVRGAPAAPARHASPKAAAPVAPDAGRSAPPAARAEQHEFLFNEHESRGYFDKTDRNLFEGQDLDVPTYLRKGIKIAV
jgi:cell division protein FtsZ